MKRITIACALAALAACASTVETSEPAPGGNVPIEELNQRIIKSSALPRHLEVTHAFVRRENDVLQVQLELESSANFATDFRYLFEWFDADGMKLYEASEGWRRETIEAGHRLSLQACASNGDATDWRFTMEKWDR